MVGFVYDATRQMCLPSFYRTEFLNLDLLKWLRLSVLEQTRKQTNMAPILGAECESGVDIIFWCAGDDESIWLVLTQLVYAAELFWINTGE